jgi:Domain of unknown function (DUF4383)
MSSLQSPPMDGPSPARLFATAGGAILVTAGIVGFFYSASFGSPGGVDEVFGAFAVNGWDNVLHALTGALCLLAADYSSRRCALLVGLFYFVLGFWGFAIGSGEAVLGFLPVNSGDNLFHLAIGCLGILAWRGTPVAKKVVATTA